ncbi:MAG: insulinase family protein [Acidobacteria bacterium]|nr:insulinase family protein [Acidobacteriota bacterium]
MARIMWLPLAASITTLAWSESLPSGVQKTTSVEGITEYSLSNGLRILLFPDPSKPKVTVNMTYLVGSLHEGSGENGMAHLLEHLLFLQTTKRTSIIKELKDHGAAWNGTTGFDRTNYFETLTANEENLKWAIGLEADRMVNAKMEKGILDPEMTVVRNEWEGGENYQENVLYQRTMRAAYSWHRYGTWVVGARSDIENVPIERLRAFYRKYYQPDNAVLTIAGAFDGEKTLGWVAAAFGSIPRPGRHVETPYTVEPAQDGQRNVEVRRVGGVPSLFLVYHVPAVAHADSAALDVLSGVLRIPPAGRLHKALVESGKAVSAGSFVELLRQPGSLTANVRLGKDQSVEEARKVAIHVIEGLASEPPTRQEVERVRARLLKQTELSFNDSQQIALSLSEWISRGDWRLLFLHRDRIRDVTEQDVARVAKAYLKESNRTVGVYLPTAEPDRAEIPTVRDLASSMKGYKGGAVVSQGESFDPSPANIESRVERSRLPNGLRIVLLPKKTRGAAVTARFSLRVGDEESLFGRQKAGQLLAGMLMRGTKNKSRQRIQEEMDRLKAFVNVQGGAVGAQVPITTIEGNLINTLRLVAEILRVPAFPEAEFEQLRREHIAQLEQTRLEPASMAFQALNRHMNPNPRGDIRYISTIDEAIEDTRRVTLGQVREFYQRFWGINGAANDVLVVAGQFDPAAVRAAANELFGDWKNDARYQKVLAPYARREAVNLALVTADKQNAYFQLQTLIQMNDSHPDYPAVVLANDIFRNALFQRIRTKEGLSYSVGSFFWAMTEGDRAVFSGFAISAPQNTPKVEASFLDELARTRRAGFTAGEVATAQKAWLQNRRVSLSSDEGLVSTLVSREEDGRTLAWDAELEKKIGALTAEQVSEAFRRHIDPKAMSIVKAGDFRRAGVFQK